LWASESIIGLGLDQRFEVQESDLNTDASINNLPWLVLGAFQTEYHSHGPAPWLWWIMLVQWAGPGGSNDVQKAEDGGMLCNKVLLQVYEWYQRSGHGCG